MDPERRQTDPTPFFQVAALITELLAIAAVAAFDKLALGGEGGIPFASGYQANTVAIVNCVLIAVGVGPVATAAFDFLDSPDDKDASDSRDRGGRPFGTGALQAYGLPALAALIEELLYRGAVMGLVVDVMNRFDPGISATCALGVSMAVFLAAHPQYRTGLSVAQVTFSGMALGVLALTTNSVVAPFLLHLAMNLFAVFYERWLAPSHR
ncbi:CPBP family intramembrane glutamic endopeptidase [Slackia heliotrinireducens]|uniref:CPBP family intramembrane glutamic endopeptidase n=1 Tax=Slackia heliotrinireducens TaxID=84110 RepID=UPI0033163217